MTTAADAAQAVVVAFPPVRDQGPRGTCAAFAVTAAHEHGCDQQDLSEEHAYWLGRRGRTGPGDGVAVGDVLDGLHADGQLDEEDWPYGRPPPDGPFPAPAARTCPLPGWERLPDCRVGTVRRHVSAGTPVILTVAFAPDVWFDAQDGWLPDTPAAAVVGAHAVLAVASTDGPSGPALLLRNSWGPSWGRSGYAWAPASLLERHLLAAHAVVARGAA